MIRDRGDERADRNRWTPWDTAPDRAADDVRVYCLPHAGGSAAPYLAWTRVPDTPGLQFVPVELPGRGTRLDETPAGSMDDVVAGILSVVESRPEWERFLFFGHSMGAQIAYETSRRLAGAGGPLPVALVVSGCRPPGSPVAVDLHQRNDEDLLRGIVELGGTPAEIARHRELLELMLPVIRADLGLLARYMEQVRPTVLSCPVVALGGTDDRLAGPEWITGWRATTTGRFRHRIFRGDHFFPYDHSTDVLAEIADAARPAPGSTGD